VGCSKLWCVAACCSMLQCVAVCCRVLQCVAVYCSVSLNLRVRRPRVAECSKEEDNAAALSIHEDMCVCIFRKIATNDRALLRKMTYKDQASFGSSPPCIHDKTCARDRAVECVVVCCSKVQTVAECCRNHSI